MEKTGFYEIPQEIMEGIGSYREEVERFVRGDVSHHQFKAFRVTWGVYGQREKGTYMVRVRVPAGGITPVQMEGMADLSEKYGNGILHITTRQDIQIHWVKIEDTVKVLEGLARVGLVTKGSGGNTVRNVTACAESGVCKREVFDVAPYAISLTEHLMTHPKAYTLPRKFKIAFSGCSKDCALATVNDLGFIAAEKVVDGMKKKGFRVYVAGGMGAQSRVADLLEDFIEADEVPYVAEAVMNLFDKHGNRRNKHKARLRFVMERLGYERFLDIYREELRAVKREARKLRLREIAPVSKGIEPLGTDNRGINDRGFQKWLGTNVSPQRQTGYHMVKVRIRQGDINAHKLKELSSLVREYGEGAIRATHKQNVAIRWVKEEELYPLYEDLRDLDLAMPGADTVSDITCCPGATTCNLGICHSRGMVDALTDLLNDGSLSLQELKDVNIKVSGCPNSCGQHPIGGIGLHGASRRHEGRLAPYYHVLIGGHVEEGKTRLAESFGFIPARRVPALVKELLTIYLKEVEKSGGFHAFIERRVDDVKELVKRYSVMPSYEEDRGFYCDWGRDEEFSLAGLGPGECGAGVFDMIETDIENARKSLAEVREAMNESAGRECSEELYNALIFSSRALLVTQGLDPKNDREALKGFEERFVNPRLVSSRYLGLGQWAANLLLGRWTLQEAYEHIKGLLEEVSALYAGMDDSLRFPEKKAELKGEEKPISSQRIGDHFMDLRGVACPMNYMKAKLQIEEMELDQTIFLYLDEGEPINNVPVSLQDDGQEIVRVEKMGDFYGLLLRKAV